MASIYKFDFKVEFLLKEIDKSLQNNKQLDLGVGL